MIPFWSDCCDYRRTYSGGWWFYWFVFVPSTLKYFNLISSASFSSFYLGWLGFVEKYFLWRSSYYWALEAIWMFSEGSVKLCGLTWMNTEGSSSILLVIFSRRYWRYTASPSCPIESSFFPDWSKLGFDCACLTSSLLSLTTKFVLTSLWALL